MDHRVVTDKAAILAFVRDRALLHALELGDLDAFHFPHTTWYGATEGGAIRQLALLYTASALPTLIAFPEEPREGMRELLASLAPVLPARCHVHSMPDTIVALEGAFALEAHGLFDRMALAAPARLDGVDTADVARIGPDDEPALHALYAAAYPDTWFSPRMLATRFYFGVWREAALVAIAGVHVCSSEYDIAVLGNIATHPAHRGRGLATQTTAHLCRALRAAGITRIALNVEQRNAAAVACYTRLGFEAIATFGEYTATRSEPITAQAPARNG